MIKIIKKQNIKKYFFGILLWNISSLLWAQNIKLKADSGEYDGLKEIATYSGNVEIEQANMKLIGDKVLVYFAKNEVIKIEAYGKPAKFAYKPENEPVINGQGNFMQYDVKNKKVFIQENAQVQQGVNIAKASSIHYDLQKEKLKTNRVEMIFQPKK